MAKLTRNDIIPALARPAMYAGAQGDRTMHEYLADSLVYVLNNRYPTNKKTEIQLCSSCSGEGIITEKELTCYHKGEYRYWDEICKSCNGSGRRKFTKETYETIEPYETPECQS